MSEPIAARLMAQPKPEGMTVKQAACNAARRALDLLDTERARLQAELTRNDEERQATLTFLAALEK